MSENRNVLNLEKASVYHSSLTEERLKPRSDKEHALKVTSLIISRAERPVPVFAVGPQDRHCRKKALALALLGPAN